MISVNVCQKMTMILISYIFYCNINKDKKALKQMKNQKVNLLIWTDEVVLHILNMHLIRYLNYLIWWGDKNNVAYLYPKNMGCGPRVQKVSHPWSWQWTQARYLDKVKSYSGLASVFDPLRLILPFLVHSKVIIQEVWKLKVNWDEIIPE